MKRTMLVVLLAVVALGLMATTAFAAPSATGQVTINASVNKAVALTLLDPVITFGPIDPGTNQQQNCRIFVKSNFDYTVGRTNSGDFAANGFSLPTPGFVDGADQVATGSSGQTFTDVYQFDASWDMVAGTTYTSTVDYTVTAKP